MAMGTPDVCLVPAPPGPDIPTPLVNQAQCPAANAATCSKKVTVMNQPVCTEATIIPLTQGDDLGVGGGVVSGTFIQQAAYKQGSTKVLVEGNPVVTALSTTAHNGSNANNPAGSQLTPSQMKVIVGS
jgi:hypothetical protein